MDPTPREAEDRHWPSRRTILLTAAGATALMTIGPAQAEPEDMEKAIHSFTQGAAIKAGKVKLDVEPLVENGNSVAIAVRVDHAMTAASHVKTIAVFNEKNPQPEVARFHLGPHNGVAAVATRIRLATTQKLAAIARMSDGSYWMDEVEVIVTIAACTEE